MCYNIYLYAYIFLFWGGTQCLVCVKCSTMSYAPGPVPSILLLCVFSNHLPLNSGLFKVNFPHSITRLPYLCLKPIILRAKTKT